jgi:hypothetical protein
MVEAARVTFLKERERGSMSTKTNKQGGRKVLAPMINDVCRRVAMRCSAQMVFVVIVVGVMAVEVAGANAAEAVNYDTAWTFVYDGGRCTTGLKRAIPDAFYDIKELPTGGSICVGVTTDSANYKGIFIVKLSNIGKLVWKKRYFRSGIGKSICIAPNGDFIIGGARTLQPLIMRTDTAGNIKWSTWYYDSIQGRSLLLGPGIVNSIRETSRVTIITAAGDEFPDNGGQNLTNYAACLELDSSGTVRNRYEWPSITGYKFGGFCIEELTPTSYLISGNQAAGCWDTSGNSLWRTSYTFSLPEVGTVVNNVMRAKKIRGGTLIVAGQAYEGNCWRRYQTFYSDAWWSPASFTNGQNSEWDTAGTQGSNESLYDFTQLIDNKLVFVGKKDDFVNGGVWVFITDSTARNVLWEKQFRIPYRSSPGITPRPLSVCATADSGFTVVGDYNCHDSLGGTNAFAAHFKPAPATAAISGSVTAPPKMAAQVTVKATKVVFTFEHASRQPTRVTIYNAAGKAVADLTEPECKTDHSTIIWDRSSVAQGVYVYCINTTLGQTTGKIVLNGRGD